MSCVRCCLINAGRIASSTHVANHGKLSTRYTRARGRASARSTQREITKYSLR